MKQFDEIYIVHLFHSFYHVKQDNQILHLNENNRKRRRVVNQNYKKNKL
ncbi:unnamed protein product [Schistosoma margrebowiei]|uniref:Uncharacterized protein n=1 Tax=Schistosoma margrebowiei TaxID=48269 RepID=A0A3P7ZK27_9TREM|nr:unnamed protein product [Schistosoma margrebowiei]